MVDDNDLILDPAASSSNTSDEMPDFLYQMFLSLVALLCLAGTIKYWASLMGVADGGALRFDLAPLHWQLAGVVLALLMPLTALGIWFRNAFGWWGCVLIIFLHYMMHAVLPNWYGRNDLFLITSAIIVVVFLLFQAGFYVRQRNADRDAGNI